MRNPLVRGILVGLLIIASSYVFWYLPTQMGTPRVQVQFESSIPKP